MKNMNLPPQTIYQPFNFLNIVISLSLLISTSLLGADKEPIGKVISTVGTVKAVSADKNERTLKRGDPFHTLEKILVEAASKVQLKFIDGGIINLIASTEYQVDSYVKNEKDKKGESISTLAKGGFRAISGSIGKENPEGVKIKTPIATIGLRGTTYRALIQNGNLDVGCEYGTVSVQNDQGEINIGPTSDTLYSTVALNEAPVASPEEPTALAETSFAVEGGESFGTEPGEEEAGSGNVEDDQEPLTEDSDEEAESDQESESDLEEEPEEEADNEEEEPGTEEEEPSSEEELESEEEELTPEEYESEEPEGEEETEESGAEEELEIPEEESTAEEAEETTGEEPGEEGAEPEETDTGEEPLDTGETEQGSSEEENLFGEEGAEPGETEQGSSEESSSFDGEEGSTEDSFHSESEGSESFGEEGPSSSFESGGGEGGSEGE